MAKDNQETQPLLFRFTGRKFYLMKIPQNQDHPLWERMKEITQLREHGYFYVYDLLELAKEGYSFRVLENVGGRPEGNEDNLTLRELKEGVSEERISKFDITSEILLNSLVDNLRENRFYEELDLEDIEKLQQLAIHPHEAAKAMAKALRGM